MCGIAGLCNFKGDIEKNIEKMNSEKFHFEKGLNYSIFHAKHFLQGIHITS